MLYHLLYPIHETIGAFRVFRYITFRTVAATLTAMFICFIVGPYLINFLRNKQLGQVIREDVPKSHGKKAGTPTMGGILILLAVAVSTLLWARLDNMYVWIVLFAALGMGGVGFFDDYTKLKYKKKGISPRQKMRLQLLVAVIVSCLMLMGDHFPSLPHIGNFDSRIFLPFFKGISLDIGWLFVVWVILVVVGSSNAVNLTDGLDGLAIGPVMTASVTFLILTYVTGNGSISEYLNITYIRDSAELPIFCGAMFGAGLGFLWYNTYPAQVFMGDVGSLGIGGALGALALLIKQELLWVIIGGIFVMETVSVIMQVISFKTTGKRIFKMAPIHHHFELKGWAEPKVIVRFWIISIILSLLALSTLKLR